MAPRRRWRFLAFAVLVGASSVLSLVSHGDAHAQPVQARPWLGVAMDGDTQAAGVRVGHVVRGSPADKAGVREGDRVMRVGTVPVARGADVVQRVATYGVGDVIEIGLLRGGKEQSVRVTLAPFPSQDDMMRMDLVGSFAPSWKGVEGVSGTFPASIEAVRGRVVILDFWATWCAPCRVVMPKLGVLQARYGAQGLSVLGVSTEDPQDVAVFAQRVAVRYAVGVDRRAETTRSYGVVSLPTVVVIDKRGVIRDVSVGYDSSQDTRLESTVRSLLAEPSPAD
jgi:thiol-disulfide isomerase/thioredoxin